MKLTRRILVLTLACAAVSYPIAFAATSVTQRAAPPHIASASPSQIATSNNTTTISINGSGFDSNARVELMYDVGPGAGQWRLPRHGYQLLNASQIRLTVIPGTDPDQLRIRVVSGNGTSNQTTVRIVASAPKAVAAPKPSVSVTQPSMTNAGSTPPIAPSLHPKTVTSQATPTLPTPKITTITPPSLTVSTQTQTITINGSGFDRDTRVEWMYGVGNGAGQWRSPRNTPEVLSGTRIRVSMKSGNDPDQMQIRVVNKQGVSNSATLAISTAPSNLGGARATNGARAAPISVAAGTNGFDALGQVVAGKYHTGVDYPAQAGTAVYAIIDGTITAVPMGSGDNHCMGNIVFLSAPNNQYYLYAHLQSISVATGKLVKAGTKIGEVGNTGMNSKARERCGRAGPHLHLELKDSQVMHNPRGNGQYWGYTPSSAIGYGYHNPAR